MKDILYNSLAQAIVKLFKKSHFSLKLILLLFILSSISLASFMVISTIIDYYSYDVITNSRVIYETPTLFPKITICNNNQFCTLKAIEFFKQINKELNASGDIFNETQMLNLTYDFKQETIKLVYNAAVARMLSKNFSDEH